MNYRTPSQGPTRLVLGNSIFLPKSNPVRILAYGEFADPAAVQQVDATIADVAGGRLYTVTRAAHSADVPTILRKSDFDVFLVYEQTGAKAGDLSNMGDLWAASLESFSYVGGVIVVLDGGQGVREMAQLITSTRMIQVTDEVVLTPPPTLSNRLPGDAVGSNITTALPAQLDTCVFETPVIQDANTAFVITELGAAATARPVVIHLTRIAPQP
jgi:hypothetical protein